MRLRSEDRAFRRRARDAGSAVRRDNRARASDTSRLRHDQRDRPDVDLVARFTAYSIVSGENCWPVDREHFHPGGQAGAPRRRVFAHVLHVALVAQVGTVGVPSRHARDRSAAVRRETRWAGPCRRAAIRRGPARRWADASRRIHVCCEERVPIVRLDLVEQLLDLRRACRSRPSGRSCDGSVKRWRNVVERARAVRALTNDRIDVEPDQLAFSRRSRPSRGELPYSPRAT